ncbi:MAG: molybdenum cofactor guanylyltransferase [Candidatus Obscuribacterales bacterium]|nr:molybdenum cofactor guanylyltransferase [Candidatus Obscuribacterales bacterium]
MNQSEREPLPLPLTAMILCGGRSKRMGRAKAFLPYAGSTMIAHIVEMLGDMFVKTLLVSNEPESYEDFGLDVVKDILPYRGPMGGILSGLLVAETDYSFVIACDMPLVNKKLVRDMTAARNGFDAVVLSHSTGLEPLFAVYSKTCVKPLEESLFAGNLSVQDLIGGLKATTFKYDQDRYECAALPPYFNINTPQDYSKLITKGSSAIHRFPEKRKS